MPKSQGRPSKEIRELNHLKPIWEAVIQKFESKGNMPAKKEDYFAELAKDTEIGSSVLADLHRKISKEVNGISISDRTVQLLRKYIGDFSVIPQSKNPDAAYFGTFECYYKMDKPPFLRNARLEIGDGYIVFIKEGERFEGKRFEMRFGNLYITVSSEKRIFHLILNVGIASHENLGLIPGFMTSINSSMLPLFFVVLLVRTDVQRIIDYDSYFKHYEKTVFRGWHINRMTELFGSKPSRISGLFDTWYIYHREKNGDIRRGKVLIKDMDTIEYVGTEHHFEQGSIQLINTSHISIQLVKTDNTKILTLLGKVGDKSNLKDIQMIKCIFSSTGKGGTVLKGGSCALVRDKLVSFIEMTPAVIKKGTSEFEYLEKINLFGYLPDNQDIEV